MNKLPKPNKPLAAQPDQDKNEGIEDTDNMMHQVGLGHEAMNKDEGAQPKLNSQQDKEEDEEEEQQN